MFAKGFNSHEKLLWKQKTTALEAIGIPRRKARKEAKCHVQEAISQSKEFGHYGADPMGDYALRMFKTEATRKKLWETMKNDGITDEDVKAWWNISSVERQMMLNDEERFRLGFWLERIDAGQTPEQAARFVWKAYPMIGDCTDSPAIPDDDTSVPLQPELKLRIMRWQEEVQRMGKVQEMKEEAEQFTTMNGYIRHLIRHGRI